MTPGSRQTLGCLFILATAAIWIVTSFISESLVSSSGSKPSQVHPFLLTYLATSLFTLYLPALGIKAWITEARHARSQNADRTSAVPQNNSANARNPKHTSMRGSDGSFLSPLVRTTMIAAAWVTPIWFVAQYTFNTSLAYTSVTSNTILSSTSSLFAFIFSLMILGEKFAANKVLAIAACIGGTALVTFSDTESGSSGDASLRGDVLAVISACLYGCYTVLMRKKLPEEDGEANVAMFFGYVGLFNTVLLAPFVILFSVMGVFSLSSIPKETYFIIVLEGLLDYVLSDYLWARAVMLVGPTVASLGMSIQIPMAATAELAMGKAAWLRSSKTIIMTAAGTLLILSGFFSINLSFKNDQASPEGAKQQTMKARCSDTDDDNEEEAAKLLESTAGSSRVEDQELGVGSRDTKDKEAKVCNGSQ